MDLTSFLLLHGFSKTSPMRRSDVKLGVEGDQDDLASKRVFLSRTSSDPATKDIQNFAEVLAVDYDLKITSYFRDSLTHRLGAVDFAPDLGSPKYAHNRAIDPRLYARKELLSSIIKAIEKIRPDGRLIQILIEDNHIHVHPRRVGLEVARLPDQPVVAQLTQRPGYTRSNDDVDSDSFIFRGSYWRVIDSELISSLPTFQARFPY